MQQPYNLQRLQQLRTRGQAPTLPVFLTNSWTFEKNLEATGALVIHVKPDDAERDWRAVAGLDVILNVPETKSWTPLAKAVRDVSPRRFRVLNENGLSVIWRGQ